MKKSNVVLDKQITIGFMIRKISKLEMNTHYERLKKTFKDNLRLVYTDTLVTTLKTTF